MLKVEESLSFKRESLNPTKKLLFEIDVRFVLKSKVNSLF